MRTVTIIMMLLIAVPVVADTYKWEDDQGTLNFTEDLGKIPKKFRKKAQKIGDVESAPAMDADGKDKAAGQQRNEATSGKVNQDGFQQPQSPEKASLKAIYGDKTGAAWRSEFAQVNGDLKTAESELVKNRKLYDSKGISREDTLALINTLRANETNVLKLRKQQDLLKNEAFKAGVPAELME